MGTDLEPRERKPVVDVSKRCSECGKIKRGRERIGEGRRRKREGERWREGRRGKSAHTREGKRGERERERERERDDTKTATHHFPLRVMTTHGAPVSSTSFSTELLKQMALMMPSPNFSFMTALKA